MRRDYIAMAFVCIILGIMCSIQFKSHYTNVNYLSANQWSELTLQKDHLQSQHDALLHEKASLQNQLVSTSAKEQDMIQQELLDKSNIGAGLTLVTGTGLIVKLDNNENPEGFTIQYWNLAILINELKSAGAEAISINGQRIVATSAVSTDGQTIIVNNNSINPPYIIQSIGNPQILESSLRIRGGEINALALNGIKVTIQTSNDIEIPAFQGSTKYHYAQPLDVLSKNI